MVRLHPHSWFVSRRSVAGPAMLVAAALLTLSGCGSDGDDGAIVGRDGAPPPADEFDYVPNLDVADAEIRVVDNSFEERYLEVSAGTTITFNNEGRNDHNIHPAEDGAFEPIETEDLAPGESASITFAEPGTYGYYCTIHGTAKNGQNGSIRVVE